MNHSLVKHCIPFSVAWYVFVLYLDAVELHHIRYFVAAAEELNISRASRRVHVSQPAMSRQIRDLEDELEAPLFVRLRFGLRLTAAGEKFLIYARQMLDICSEATRVIKKFPKAAAALNIGFIASSLGSFLGGTLRSFRERHPDILVKIHELSPAEQVVALRKRQIDLALLGNPCGAVMDEFAVRALFNLELRAVLPAQHALAGRQIINLRELAGDDFIGYNEQTFPGRNQTIANACAKARFRPTFRQHADSLVEVLAMIGSGVGVCLMPADVASLPHPNVAFVSVRQKLKPIQFSAAWRRDDERPMLKELLDCVQRPELGTQGAGVVAAGRRVSSRLARSREANRA